MGKHRDRGSSLGKMLKDIDISQIMSIMSALGGRTQNNNSNISTSVDNSKKTEDIMKLLSNDKFIETVNQLSSKMKQTEDEKGREESIREAFETIQSIVNEKK